MANMNMSNQQGVLLSSGYFMPLIGLGTWQATNESEVEEALKAAIDAGYRHIDTAYVYKNEAFIGNALKKLFESGVIKRSDLFIVTKLPSNGHEEQHVEYFLRKSLAALQLDYVDLYLIHSPVAVQNIDDDTPFPVEDGKLLVNMSTDHVKTWKAMEDLVDKGLTRSIGLSNFNSKQIQRIVDNARIKPSNLQVECHVYFPQYELHEFCKKRNITFTAYSPLGSPALPEFCKKNYGIEIDVPNLLKEPKVLSLAEKHKKTPAQVLLRYLIQRGIVVIPKSSNPKRIKENIDIFDFSLSAEDMDELKSLNKNFRYLQFDHFKEMVEHPEYPFHEPF